MAGGQTGGGSAAGEHLPAAASPLLQAFDFQVRWCREPAPFTSRVLRRSRDWLAQDGAAHAAFSAFSEDPLSAAMALRWAGALHHLALRGLQPWCDLWPPSGAVPDVDAEVPGLDAALDAAIRRAWAEQRPHAKAALALPPQTNEVMRSAVLLPGLLHVAEQAGLPLVLLEVGASAGLNLWCERYRHAHGLWAFGPAGTEPVLSSEWRGALPSAAGTDLRPGLQIHRRAGCDANPIDLSIPDEGLRLASFIWPEQRQRLTRLQAARQSAAAWMAAEGVRVQSAQAADFVACELQQVSPGHTTVLMHSVVWQYIDPAEQAAITATVEAAGARATPQAPLAWLRMEPPTPDSPVELRCRLWPGGEDRLLAMVHPHGTWIEWAGSH